MGMNFPNTPASGQIFSAPGGYQYIYLNGIWQVIAAPQSTGTALSRNKLVNGAMQISQENGTTASPTAATGSYYPADQWFGQWSLTGTAYVNWDNASWFSVSGSHVNVFIGGTATPSPAAGAYLMLTQKIEGLQVADLKWGAASARQAILRFTCVSDVPGTYCMQVTNADNSRSFLAPFTITTAAVAQTFTLVIPGDTTGTWAKNNTNGIMIGVALTSGSTYIGVAGWQAGNKIQTSGNTNLAATAGKYFALADVGFYADPQNTGVAPAWQVPDYAQEHESCRRYWQANGIIFSANVTSGTTYYSRTMFSTPMRTAPAVTGTPVGGVACFPNAVGTISSDTISVQESRLANGTAGGAWSTGAVLNARM